MDGQAVLACLVPAAAADGRSVTTIEGATSETEHDLEASLVSCGAVQCGYCIPGMVISAVALFRRNPSPSDDKIVAWMNGNLCRCGGYTRILDALRRVAGATSSKGSHP